MTTRNRIFENTLRDYIERALSRLKNAPLFLGGSSGPNGGTGGPPGGSIGMLPQSLVTYDTTEAATLNGSSSLVDNLNHIRARVGGFNQTGPSLEDELIERIWFMGQ